MIFVTEPAIIEKVEKSTVAEGGYLTLSCQVSGDPFPSVSWVKVMSGKRFNGSNLSLRNVNGDASGEYRCEAANLCSSVSRKTEVDVQCKYDTDPVSWSIVLTISFGSVLMVTRKKNICPELHVMLCTRDRGWRVVRAAAFCQCDPGSIPKPAVICGVSWLVLYSAVRDFFPGYSSFLLHQKPKP